MFESTLWGKNTQTTYTRKQNQNKNNKVTVSKQVHSPLFLIKT